MTTAQQSHDGFQEGLRARVPLKRWGTPEDFEGIAVFLASPASSFVTGTEMIVDGGYSAS
jgi:NAD(P)-dependent dehydrogenase (short-subunit alcohol dehydrogenase family)